MPPNVPQRFAFPFALQFDNDSMSSSSLAVQDITVTAVRPQPVRRWPMRGLLCGCSGRRTPTILDGDPGRGLDWWTSIDMRVFQVSRAAHRFGATLATGGSAVSAASNFIQTVVDEPQHAPALGQRLRRDRPGGGARGAHAGADGRLRPPRLQLRAREGPAARPQPGRGQCPCVLPHVAGAADQRRARPDDPLPHVHLGLTAPCRCSADRATRSRRSRSSRPVASNSAAVSMTTQTDTPNVRTIVHDTGAGVIAFFGCWLDINQPNDLRFPARLLGTTPGNLPDGPFVGAGPLLSIQQHIRSLHQCLIAEINLDGQTIPGSADPSTSDKLAQRKPDVRERPEPRCRRLPGRAAERCRSARPRPRRSTTSRTGSHDRVGHVPHRHVRPSTCRRSTLRRSGLGAPDLRVAPARLFDTHPCRARHAERHLRPSPAHRSSTMSA